MESTGEQKIVSLNQTYRRRRTFDDHPAVFETLLSIAQLTKSVGFVRPHDGSPKGRIYDDAVLFQLAGGKDYFAGKRVCELGARDGLFGSYLTQWAKTVHVSDYFEQWGKGTEHDLGQLDQWSKLWRAAAGPNDDRLYCGAQDMLALSYSDNEFDCVISTSVIEHLFPQLTDSAGRYCGDLRALDEMIRVCRPGGLLLLSTDMIGGEHASTYHSGTHYYNKKDLLERLVQREGVELYAPAGSGSEPYNFDVHDEDNDAIDSHDHLYPTCSVVFALRVVKKH